MPKYLIQGSYTVDGIKGVSMIVPATGTVRDRTTVLLTPEEMDQAAKKTVSARPPGH
jgi:hypothetical protein